SRDSPSTIPTPVAPVHAETHFTDIRVPLPHTTRPTPRQASGAVAGCRRLSTHRDGAPGRPIDEGASTERRRQGCAYRLGHRDVGACYADLHLWFLALGQRDGDLGGGLDRFDVIELPIAAGQ